MSSLIQRTSSSLKPPAAFARRRTPSRRRGAMLVVALACLAIVMAIVGIMLQGALRARRQLHVERDLRQVELLLEAGLDRAAFQLANDDGYEGETWRIPASELLGSGEAEVVIVAQRSDDAEPSQVRVAAEYPVGAVTSIRRTRTFQVQD